MNQAYQLHYQIQTTAQGFVLQVWEMLPEHDESRIHRSSDFLFRLNFRIETLESAHDLLCKYLTLIGVSEVDEMPVDEIQFININPIATEEFMPQDPFQYDLKSGYQF